MSKKPGDEDHAKSFHVRKVMAKVPREEFAPKEHRDIASADFPIPIPGGATMSARHMHTMMLSALELRHGDKVLEIGIGSGVLLAYIKEMVGERGKVFGVEIVPETYEFGRRNLEKTGYGKKVSLSLGDGSLGMSEHAPFDRIVCSAAVKSVPKAWKDQLRGGGLILTPVGTPHGLQVLCRFEKKKGRLVKEELADVSFVPLTGSHG